MTKVKDIPIYYLNPDSYKERRIEMEKFLDSLNMKYERIPSNSSSKSKPVRTAEGFLKIAEKAIKNNVFPFLVLEDDARLIVPLPEEIHIPKEAVIIYWGASTYECGGGKPGMFISNYNNDYYRVCNSLGGHARLIPSIESTLHYIGILEESISKNTFSDIRFAIDSGTTLYLTPKDGPYFYQDDRRTKGVTYFLWKDKQKKLR